MAATKGILTTGVVYLRSAAALDITGATTITRAGIGVTSTDGLVLSNTTAAAAGAQQMSPRLRFDGFGWKTDATAASQAVSVINELLPVQGTSAPTANLLWKYSVNGGAYSTIATLTSTGALTIVGGLSCTTIDASNNINTTSRYRLGDVTLISATAPTIASGFGTSPSISAANGTAAFTVTIGTGGSESTGVLTLPAASNGWVVMCVDITNAASFVTAQTAGTTTSATLTNYSRTTGLATAWTAGDVIRCLALAY